MLQVVKARYNRPFRNLPEDQDHAFEVGTDLLVHADGSRVQNRFSLFLPGWHIEAVIVLCRSPTMCLLLRWGL